jgi:ADP-heptose:LPS heptosyltransferase
VLHEGPVVSPVRRRVLVARLDNLGDVLLAGPAVRAVAAQASVVVACGPRGRASAELLPGVEEIIELDAPWVGFEPTPFDRAALDAFVAAVRSARVDEAIVLTSDHQSPLPLAMLLREAGVGRISAHAHDYPGSLLDLRRPEPGDVHEVERGLGLAAAAGFPLPAADDGRLRVELGPGVCREVPFPAERYVVVHPGASVAARALPAVLAQDAVVGLVRAGWAVVVTGPAGEPSARRAVAALERPERSALRDLSGRLSWAGLGRVLAGAAAVVCGNTGPAHLAAAVGTPVVSVFAPVVPVARWRPWAVPHVVLGDQGIACRGCRARTCPLDAQDCVASLSGGDVVAAVERLAGPPRSGPGSSAAPRCAGAWPT